MRPPEPGISSEAAPETGEVETPAEGEEAKAGDAAKPVESAEEAETQAEVEPADAEEGEKTEPDVPVVKPEPRE